MLCAVGAQLKERYSASALAAELRASPAAVVVLATLEENFTCAMLAAAKFEVRGARSQSYAGLAEMLQCARTVFSPTIGSPNRTDGAYFGPTSFIT